MGKKEKMFEIMKKATENGWEIGGTQSSKLNMGGFTLLPPRELLFDHDFAKAVFGESKPATFGSCKNCGGEVIKDIGKYGWQYHIMQAVISKDPIDYYYKYISEKGKKK